MEPSQAPQDVAFNPNLWGYNTGKIDRQHHLVIRVREDGRTDTRTARQAAQNTDTSGAGKDWSEAELDIQDVGLGSLVAVIGETIPQSVYEGNFARVDGPVVATEAVSTMMVFPTRQEAQIVVRRLKEKLCTFFVLRDKQNDLCGIVALPRNTEIAYYSEWTGGVHSRAEKRKAAWNRGINDFCRARRHESPATGSSNALLETTAMTVSADVTIRRAIGAHTSAMRLSWLTLVREGKTGMPLDLNQINELVQNHLVSIVWERNDDDGTGIKDVMELYEAAYHGLGAPTLDGNTILVFTDAIRQGTIDLTKIPENGLLKLLHKFNGAYSQMKDTIPQEVLVPMACAIAAAIKTTPEDRLKSPDQLRPLNTENGIDGLILFLRDEARTTDMQIECMDKLTSATHQVMSQKDEIALQNLSRVMSTVLELGFEEVDAILNIIRENDHIRNDEWIKIMNGLKALAVKRKAAIQTLLAALTDHDDACMDDDEIMEH